MLKIGWILMLSIFLVGCHSTPAKTNSACNMKPDAGPCKAAIPKYYFNQKIQSCSTFNWGGCKGSIPFDDLTSCQQSCENQSSTSERKRWFHLFNFEGKNEL